MPEIEAFRGLRYDLGHVGSLSDVVAPPYDVIDEPFQNELYEKHPANCIRLILNREEPGDDDSTNRYTRAARFLRNWIGEGVLAYEPDAAVYVYHQVFNAGGTEFTRRGFMARVKLQRFGEGNIYPHEQTHAAAKVDRLNLWRACRHNMSQIFGLYPDPENAAQNLLENEVVNATPSEAVDHLGVVHRLWPVTNQKVISELAALVGPQPAYVADGHHRYETACNYRDELAGQQGGQLDPTHPANYVLMMLIGMQDPGLIVLPTHRLFRGVAAISAEELATKLGEHFELTPGGAGPAAARELWTQIETENDQRLMAFYTAQDRQWTLARLNAAGRAKLDAIAAEQSSDWRGLGVAILHRLAVETLLGYAELPKAKYVHEVEELVDGLEGDTAGEFQLASLVMPATLEHIRLISEHGERMPPKSTYFYPKLLSGLVFNPLE